MTTRTRRVGVHKMPRDLTLEKAKNHVLKPAHTIDIEVEQDEAAFKIKKRPRPKIKVTPKPKLNLDDFCKDLDAILKTSTAGYALEIRQNGSPIVGLVAGWAHTPDDGRLRWNGNIRMHIASVSKLLTAIGLVKLLDRKKISLNDTIKRFLPAYWSKGPNIDKITFRRLLRHKSGLGVLTAVAGAKKSASDFAYMKQNIAVGALDPPQSKYRNVNYGLMRILIPVINGDIDVDHKPTAVQARDAIWDSLTIGHYKDYMQDHVFGPAGVASAGFAPLSGAVNSALAYSFPPGDGWNSGDLQTVAGGAGWRLSVGELLNVMNHFRRQNTIVRADLAQEILDNKLGLDDKLETGAGTIYFKCGSWGKGARHEKSVAYFLPNNMEMVIFVNSPVFPQSYSLHKLVSDIYQNSIE